MPVGLIGWIIGNAISIAILTYVVTKEQLK